VLLATDAISETGERSLGELHNVPTNGETCFGPSILTDIAEPDVYKSGHHEWIHSASN